MLSVTTYIRTVFTWSAEAWTRVKNAQALLLVLHADPFQNPICLPTLKNVNEEDFVTDIFSIKYSYTHLSTFENQL